MAAPRIVEGTDGRTEIAPSGKLPFCALILTRTFSTPRTFQSS